MDAMVTARVPVEIKKRAGKVLKEQGSTASEQINCLFDYLSSTGELPDFSALRNAGREVGGDALAGNRPHKLVFDELPEEQKEKLRTIKRLREFKKSIDWGEDADRPYNELIEEALRERYEALS